MLYTFAMVLLLSDVNECQEGTDLCAQNCHNSIGSYVCTCVDGFIISIDGMNCIGEVYIVIILWSWTSVLSVSLANSSPPRWYSYCHFQIIEHSLNTNGYTAALILGHWMTFMHCLEMQTSMSVVMVFIAVSRCAIIPKDHITVSVSMAMNSIVMATHAVVSRGLKCMHSCLIELIVGLYCMRINAAWPTSKWLKFNLVINSRLTVFRTLDKPIGSITAHKMSTNIFWDIKYDLLLGHF